jgi:PAS domain S-box-containing protein
MTEVTGGREKEKKAGILSSDINHRLNNDAPDQKICILYVDDDPQMTQFFSTYLEKMGNFKVISVQDGREAIILLSKEHSCDIIVSDYHMPNMNGIELLKESKKIPYPPPFILFTGKGREEVVIEAINNGAAFYLQKGGEIEALFAELAHKIRQAVGKQLAESGLRESEEKYRLLFESARDAILIIKDGYIADCNQQATVFFRGSVEDLKGIPIRNIFPKTQPDGSISNDKWNEYCETVLSGSHAFMTWRYRRLDGSLFDAEASLNHLDLDRIPCIQVVLRDISERIQAEQELSTRNIELSAAYEELKAAGEERKYHLNELIAKQQKLAESEEKYRELADLLPQVVFETDRQGKLIYANRQAYITFGYSPEINPDNLNVFDMLVPKDRIQAQRNLSRLINEGISVPHEYQAVRSDGTIFPVIIHSSRIFRNSQYQGVRGILIDITERKRYEDALLRSEEKYRTLIEHIQDSVFIIQDGRLKFVNPAFAALLGYSAQEVIDEKITRFIAPEDREMVTETYHKRINGDEVPNKYEFRMVKSDGHTRVLVSMDIGLIIFQGNQASIGTIRDITRERQAEEAVRESERRLADVIDFLPDATLVIDREGRVIAWNRAMEQLTNVPAKKMLGQSDYSYSIPFYGVKRPILVDMALKADESVEREYVSLRRTPDVLVGESFMHNWSGGTKFLWGAASALYDSKGNIVGAIESIRDITDRKRAEEALIKAREELEERVRIRTAELTEVNATLMNEVQERRLAEVALRESEERYRRLIDLSPDAVFVHDKKRVLFVNQAGVTLLGATSPEDIIGVLLSDIVHPEYIELIQKTGEITSTDKESPRTIEGEFIRGDQTVVDVEVSSAPIVYSGQPAILVIVRDSTERKKAAKQLQRYAEEMEEKNKELDFLANQLIEMNQELDKRVKDRTSQVIALMKQKDAFITQLGHDLKTPLTPLRALLPILIQDAIEPETKETLLVLLRSVHSIQDQTEKILTIARLNQDKITVNPVPVRVCRCVTTSVEKHRILMQQKNISVTIDIPENLILRFSDADALTVFDNLIGNAVKYTPEGGNIAIKSHVEKSRVGICIIDDGIGLSSEEAEHVFDEFYMADPSRHDRSSSGLGLSIVRRLVMLYGGTIKVKSEGKNKGATFYVCFPGS